MAKEQDKSQPGPDPDRLKIEGDWEEAVGRALEKKRPSEGWPEPPPTPPTPPRKKKDEGGK